MRLPKHDDGTRLTGTGMMAQSTGMGLDKTSWMGQGEGYQDGEMQMAWQDKSMGKN